MLNTSQQDFRARQADVHRFSMIPRADIPRSRFQINHQHKTTFDSGFLVPIYVDEVLPGDHFKLSATCFARLATPLFPVMDNLFLDTFFFFVPNRLLWDNWQRFQGERDNPNDSTDFIIPTMTSPAGGYAVNSLQDYMGLPTVGQVASGATVTHAALHTRAYNLIYNEWFRDQNLQDSVVVDKGDGPDSPANYVLLRRGKRHDYFTSCLPWPQKGDSVTLPLGQAAPIRFGPSVSGGGSPVLNSYAVAASVADPTSGQQAILQYGSTLGVAIGTVPTPSSYNLYADLAEATSATINQIRQSFQVQRLLERDARGGTRYTEILRSHFGVISPDARLQRPEYLGGGETPIQINPIAQTSGTTVSGSDTPLATLSAIGTTVVNGHGFSQAFVEHGVIIGLAAVRAELSYQQGLRRMWSRSTRYDFYMPVFSHLGEQAVLNKEIYCSGVGGSSDGLDDGVFGYQERWAEYRYNPSLITGLFRSTSAGTIDPWHLSQHFTSRPTLSASWITDNPPVSRVVAVGDAANGQQFIFDSLFSASVTRPMPLYSVPGLIDHF